MLSDLILFINMYTKSYLSFKSNKILIDYQQRWIKLFSKVISNPLPEELNIRFNECFTLPINISENTTINIQFNIGNLLEEIDKVNIPTISISTQQFIENNSQNRLSLMTNSQLIGYAIEKSLKTVSSNPVIVCDSDFFFNFVLDGNHRIDYAKKKRIDIISSQVISSKFLATTPHLFEDRISYLLFCFLEDVALLAFALHQKQKTGLFGILRTESSLLKKQSILPVVQEYIEDTCHQS